MFKTSKFSKYKPQFTALLQLVTEIMSLFFLLFQRSNHSNQESLSLLLPNIQDPYFPLLAFILSSKLQLRVSLIYPIIEPEYSHFPKEFSVSGGLFYCFKPGNAFSVGRRDRQIDVIVVNDSSPTLTIDGSPALADNVLAAVEVKIVLTIDQLKKSLTDI